MTASDPQAAGDSSTAGDPAPLRQLVEALRDPAHFDHPVHAFEVVETHISIILLTGPYAYKFKKPLDLGFLNFSTLAHRKHCCEEELRLNRRLAPRHYVEVVPITGTRQHPAPGGSGPVLDYAVKMVQFPRDRELDRLAAHGGLTSRMIDQLAGQIERFHRRAAIAPPGTRFGSIESIRGPAQANFAHIAAALEPHAAEFDRLRPLEAWTQAECSVLAAQFRARRNGGWVRECHGDMHLGNMVLHDSELVIFDCIEFSEELRWIDVMSEVAFLMMDLQIRGHSELAWRFLNAYLEGSGDYRGIRVLRFYLVYRTLVRAKVACIRLRQAGLAPPAQDAEAASFRAHLDLACEYARASIPALIITHGLSGSGKTWLTQELLEALGAVRIRSDIERKRLHGLSADAKTRSGAAAGIYAPPASHATYRHLERLAALPLEAGFRVIVDAAFLRREQRAALESLARERGVPFLILDLHAPMATLRGRIQTRLAGGADASEADVRILEYQIAGREPLDASEHTASIHIDTGTPVDLPALCRQILSRLAGRHPA